MAPALRWFGAPEWLIRHLLWLYGSWKWKTLHAQMLLSSSTPSLIESRMTAPVTSSTTWPPWTSPKTVPDMTYNVFGGTLSLTQSIIAKDFPIILVANKTDIVRHRCITEEGRNQSVLIKVRRRSRRTFSTHSEISRRSFDGVVVYFFSIPTSNFSTTRRNF